MVLEPVHQHSKGLPRRQLACGPPYLSFAFWIDSFVSSLSRPPLVLASSLLSHGVRGPLRPRLRRLALSAAFMNKTWPLLYINFAINMFHLYVCTIYSWLTIAYILISQLLYGDISKQIKTRLSRLWDFHDINDEEKIYHTELVLLDETGASIHVQIYPSLRNKFKDLLQQGKVYYIDSFSVRYANRTYRPVANPLMISFTKWTTLEECIEIPDNFPSITFSLTPFQDVPSLVEKNHFYVDVMGIITEVGATATIRPKSSNTDNLKRTMQISDASGCTLPVTLWGKTTTAFEVQAIFNVGQIEPQVVVFVGTLVRNYKGIGLTLTGSSPCKWYVNLDMPEVAALKQSFTAKF
ncbi:uncharacterized protein [Oryza sativa Japonica Group]|uniref:uncharacterized protein isoform X3 n=1 Tax=Oryza sativa subsp. japonica TaxID=39947 RepID=UPI00339BBED1